MSDMTRAAWTMFEALEKRREEANKWRNIPEVAEYDCRCAKCGVDLESMPEIIEGKPLCGGCHQYSVEGDHIRVVVAKLDKDLL